MGRLKFRTSYGQNVLYHSAEVARLAGIMARELGIDAHVAVRAAFVHDIGKAIDREMEGTHLQIGIDFLRKHGESEAVVMAMAAHHMDIDWPSLEAMIVQAADAISAARPGARRDILESYVKRLEKLEGIADSFKGVSKSFALQAVAAHHMDIDWPSLEAMLVQAADAISAARPGARLSRIHN
jgi:ribonuclease Y